MAASKSAQKRLRTSEKARIRHKSRRSELFTLEKRLRAAVEAGEKDQATELAKTCCTKLDKAVKAGTIHRNKANRKKGQLTKLANSK